MTEAEWLSCTDPKVMLKFLRGKVSRRKLALFTVACCRRVWYLFDDERSRNAVVTVEEYADGVADEQKRQDAHEAAVAAYHASMTEPPDEEDTPKDFPLAPVGANPNASAAALFATHLHPSSDCVHDALTAAWYAALARGYDLRANNTWDESRGIEYAAQCNLLRDIIGNPCRSVSLYSGWRTPGVVELARTIYEGRTFNQMPELADALEQAGCDNADILDHCRQPGPHVRGCWVVDLLLGKE